MTSPLIFSGLHSITTGGQSDYPSVTSLRNYRNVTGVYVAWLKNAALYVGSSQDLGARVRKIDRKLLGRCRAFSRCDRVEIYPCETLCQARQLEVELISIYAPKYNLVGHFQSSRSLQRLQLEHAKLFGGAA